ncbi:UNVERIFIED_CONTAM: hypothetical protein GTU68_008139 [Idotea baltica]|nr:hypothetical protein [Idotea baltica]
MLPIAAKLDEIGYWSLESWGGATFDACIRYLGEDPWDRIRELKKAMPNTPQQMLFRGQNILGYRHYADDVVEKFVERAAHNGVDVFRVFDAMNDMRNIEVALRAVKNVGKHAQGTISYTLSPMHNVDTWVAQGKQIEDMGADSVVIKDMAGLLRPYVGFELVSRLKAACDIPIHMHCHATTGLSTATALKCIEAGIDNIDTAISSMSMTYGHSPTESVVAMLQGTERDTGLDIEKLEDIAAYFRKVRKKYANFEGSLRGTDSRILVAQVPGGMLTNMESQLKEQGAAEKIDQVLAEIPRVREDLGFIPLVTPTSQIVGTQSVINVLTGERYKSITKETAGILKGEYGVTPAPVNVELQARVLEGAEPITCRPADLLQPELAALNEELQAMAAEKNIELTPGEAAVDDVLTYALFPQIGLKFLENRGNPAAFEAIPDGQPAATLKSAGSVAATDTHASVSDSEVYTITVNGGDVSSVQTVVPAAPIAATAPTVKGGEPFAAPLAGNVFDVKVSAGDVVADGQVIAILEAMKMEVEVLAPHEGTIASVNIAVGDAVAVGDTLMTFG